MLKQRSGFLDEVPVPITQDFRNVLHDHGGRKQTDRDIGESMNSGLRWSSLPRDCDTMRILGRVHIQ